MDQIDAKWDITAGEIKDLVESLIQDSTKRCDTIAKSQDFTYEGVLIQFNELDRIFTGKVSFLSLLEQVSPDSKIRDTCTEAITKLNKFAIEMRMRKDLFDVLQRVNETSYETLNEEAKRYVKRSLIEGRQDGLHLDEITRNKVKELKKKISDLEIEFNKNVTEENLKFPFKREELDGVSEDTLNSLEKDENGNLLVTLKYPVYFPIMKECKIPETRRKIMIEFDSRCISTNGTIFDQILDLRHQVATILGYQNFSQYTLDLCMAKNPENVENFLTKLTEKLLVLRETELNILLDYKKKECEKSNIPYDGILHAHDLRYYTNIRDLLEFNIDHGKLQEYFPLDFVLNGIFNIYQTLLGLEFEIIPNAKVYHEEVKLYQVIDKQTKEVMGFFYTDLHPREGKFGHAAVFPMQPGCLTDIHGVRQYPTCAMVCNFTKPTEEKPALLTHEEVETFFHEFGHVMHNICARAEFCKFSGTSVETDFLEAPSQMLENWVWEKESLKLMSKHYKDGTPISDQLLDDLIRSRKSMAGYFNLRQVLFAKCDQYYHKSPTCNVKQIYHQYNKELMGFDIEDEKMNMICSFAHLTGGYESKYYSYLWSEVFSHDMFETRFKKEGILNPETGMAYRQLILKPGGSVDANQMLLNFLGREPNEEAFLRSKGLL